MAARLWQKAPFTRLLPALAAGIILQWNLQRNVKELVLLSAATLLLVIAYGISRESIRFRFRFFNGILLYLLVALLGGLITWANDVRNDRQWAGHSTNTGWYSVAVLQEPLINKANSYKAIARLQSFIRNDSSIAASGKLILYFKKDSTKPPLDYGDRVLISKTLQPIKNGGNPGGFDYRAYSLRQGITHQVFLNGNQFIPLAGPEKNWLTQFVFDTRRAVVSHIKTYIKGEKEQGLAEALLIGYKDDLDKNLVQAYSNTGVVHIIAISGLHLGLIYWLLMMLTKPLHRKKNFNWLRILLVIGSLWLFSLLAGAQPSVLRSALMFSVIAFAELAARRTNIFNTLACSAFILLCVNPFWLWDVGFQLSYAAVLSIVLFFQPVYNWFSFSNKAIDMMWKLTAVTISAQVLTLPISIYHFHQMPLLFLFTNFFAVPLSSIILLGEILLCAVFFFPAAAGLLGSLLHSLIAIMNGYIENLDRLPFAVWNHLSISLLQTMLLIVFVTAGSFWLMEKQKNLARLSLGCLTLFLALRTSSFITAYTQRKLIVYNVPRYSAIDIISGRKFAFIGDSMLLIDDFARNFHLQPSRILHRINPDSHSAVQLFSAGGKKVLLLDKPLPFSTASPRQPIDLLVLRKNPKLYISSLHRSFHIKQIVIDGSVPNWKAKLWQRDCDSFKIPYHNVSEKGAFEMNL